MGGLEKKMFGPNEHQDKSGVISFWVGGHKKCSVPICNKPHLVLSHFGWAKRLPRTKAKPPQKKPAAGECGQCTSW